MRTGQKVYIRKVAKKLLVADNNWNDEMESTLGKKGIVVGTMTRGTGMKGHSVLVDDKQWFYPVAGLSIVKSRRKQYATR